MPIAWSKKLNALVNAGLLELEFEMFLCESGSLKKSDRWERAGTSTDVLQLRVSKPQSLLSLILELVLLADIKPCLLSNRYSCIQVCSTLEFLLWPRIPLELGKQGWELLFSHSLGQQGFHPS